MILRRRKTVIGRRYSSHSRIRSTSLQRLLRWLVTDPAKNDGDTLPVSRNYQAWNSAGTFFFFGGRFRATKAKPKSLLTAFLVILPLVLFCIFEAKWLWYNVSPGVVITFVYCWSVCFASFVKAATSDPGVVPRNIHLTDDAYNLPEEYFNTISLPVRHGRSVDVKYCHTCRDWRAPRTFHCSRCDQCITIHDHHCVWINNCVGERNYRYFFSFLLFGCLSTVYLSILSYYHLFTYEKNHKLSFHHTLNHIPMTFFNAIYGNLALLYPLVLLAYHTYFAFTQQTTREFLRTLKNKSPHKNPYTLNNVILNCVVSICRPRGVSFVSSRQRYNGGDSRFQKFPVANNYSNK